MASERRYQFDGHRPRVVERPKWIDTDKEWRPKVRELADDLGFTFKSVWFWFRQISLEVFHETKWPQPVAEAWALQCVRIALDKRGKAPS